VATVAFLECGDLSLLFPRVKDRLHKKTPRQAAVEKAVMNHRTPKGRVTIASSRVEPATQ
jgi:hypothetical protein